MHSVGCDSATTAAAADPKERPGAEHPRPCHPIPHAILQLERRGEPGSFSDHLVLRLGARDAAILGRAGEGIALLNCDLEFRFKDVLVRLLADVSLLGRGVKGDLDPVDEQVTRTAGHGLFAGTPRFARAGLGCRARRLPLP